MPALVFKPRKERRLLSGHPWVYRAEVDAFKGAIRDGDVVKFHDHQGRFLGQGYVNRRSRIVARLLTTAPHPVGVDFFRQRLKTALALRDRVVTDTNAYRVVYSESDLLPGLIVDRYGPVLVTQFLTLGMERWKPVIVQILEELLHPEAIYERSDAPVRAHEGLPPVKQPLAGVCPSEARIEEGGLSFVVDIINGQKTGFFLDQRENRAAVGPFVRGARVLDGFCYTGGFALAAARGGATEVTGIDLSETAVALATRNAALNGLERLCRFRAGNVFDELRVYNEQQAQFDVIILDPPSFTRGKASVPGAYRGYKDINLRAMKLLASGGYLITCSCSYHMPEDLFRDMLLDAAHDARRAVRIIEVRSQGKDHPVLLAAQETRYLKCFILQVL